MRRTRKGYVGTLASGKRVYVYDTRRGPLALAYAVFSDTKDDGVMRLVEKIYDTEHREMTCQLGHDHDDMPGPHPCHWAFPAEGAKISAQEHAAWSAHWWRYVGKHRAEVVELKPVAARDGAEELEMRTLAVKVSE